MRIHEDRPPDDQLVWQEFYVHPESGHRWPLGDDGKPEKSKDDIQPEVVKFGLKFLKTGEKNDISTAVMQTQTSYRGKNRSPQVEAKIDHTKMVVLKLKAAIVTWQGIQDTRGKEAEVSEKIISHLPSWMTDSLLETINDMNEVGEDLMGE